MTPHIEAIYNRHCAANTAITPHLPRLRALADGFPLAIEFGVKRGASSSALLMGAERVISFDVIATAEAHELKRVAGERWDYRIADSRHADIPEADVLFIDSLHTFDQVQAELAHADKIRHFIAFHDVSTFGEVGALGETGHYSWIYVPGKGSVPDKNRGIRPAVDDLMIRDGSWRIAARYTDSHGLLVLERR